MWHSVSSIDSSKFKMSHNSDLIETSIGLSFKRLYKTIEINSKIIPTALFPIGMTFNKERFNL